MLLSSLLLLFLSFSNKITGCYLNTPVMEQYILHSGKADIVLRHQVGSPCFFVHEEKVQITSHVLRCVSSQSWRAFSSSLTLVKCNFSGKDYDCIYIYQSSNTWNDFKQFLWILRLHEWVHPKIWATVCDTIRLLLSLVRASDLSCTNGETFLTVTHTEGPLHWCPSADQFHFLSPITTPSLSTQNRK